jgi:hypothetical protein
VETHDSPSGVVIAAYGLVAREPPQNEMTQCNSGCKERMRMTMNVEKSVKVLRNVETPMPQYERNRTLSMTTGERRPRRGSRFGQLQVEFQENGSPRQAY